MQEQTNKEDYLKDPDTWNIKKKDKVYSWYDFDKAVKESGKPLITLFDFPTGLLIDREE